MYLEDKEPPPSLTEKGNLPDDMEPCQMGFLEGALLEVQGRLSGAILGFSGFVWRAATACLVARRTGCTWFTAVRRQYSTKPLPCEKPQPTIPTTMQKAWSSFIGKRYG